MLAGSDAALQHAVAPSPRPLPLFLDMVRRVAVDDPSLAARALTGLRRYAAAERPGRGGAAEVPTVQLGPLQARQSGTAGPPVLLVPSLINPSWIMDLDADRSLLRWLGSSGFRAFLLDWGAPQPRDAARDLAWHVTEKLVPAIDALGEPVHVVGYCLGGVLATAAATMRRVRSLSLIATPWHFSAYEPATRQGLSQLWSQQHDAVAALGVLPMEILQTAFWSVDPQRTVTKFAALADLAADDPGLIAFARLEDWANGGAPLSYGAGRDLFELLIRDDASGQGAWHVNGQAINPTHLDCPAHQFVAMGDRIAPAASAPRDIPRTDCSSGHVGMVVGQRARQDLWPALRAFLSA